MQKRPLFYFLSFPLSLVKQETGFFPTATWEANRRELEECSCTLIGRGEKEDSYVEKEMAIVNPEQKLFQ